MRIKILILLAALSPSLHAAGLVETRDGSNLAILVGVGDKLPGVAKDMRRIRKIITGPEYRYLVTEHREGKAIAADILREIEAYARGAGSRGSLFFYFTGHGDKGLIAVADGDITIAQIRDAVARGREGMAALPRLTFWIDSCLAGSVIEPIPMNSRALASQIADTFFSRRNGRRIPIAKLFAFASSRADEDSFSTDAGGDFTVALDKAFREMKGLGRLSELVARTRAKVTDEHPVARFVPASVGDEPLE